MGKDFHSWHELKADIDSAEKRPYIHEREIWFCHLGVNVGSEQDGRGKSFLRPVIIFRKFNNEVFWAVPLTRTDKKSKYYYNFEFEDADSTAILSQIRLIDAKRLSHKIGSIPKESFNELKEKLKALFP